MSANNQRLHAMVSAYLAAGGRIRKMPEAIPATPMEVLRYLRRHRVKAEPARAKNANVEAKYVHDGALITLDALVQLANGYRREQRLAPFEVQQPIGH